MAIETKFTFDNGIEVDKAYVRVNLVTWKKTSLVVELYLYGSALVRQEGKTPVQSEIIMMSPCNDISISSIYSHIKSLPKYHGAIDC